MGINISSLETLAKKVSKYADACGVKSILQTKPPALSGVNVAMLKFMPLEKDVVHFQNHFNKNELAVLKEKEFLPFFEKIKQKFKMDTKFKLDIKSEISVGNAEGYCNSVSTSVELLDKVLFEPTFSKVVEKATGNTAYFPVNSKFKNAKSFLVGNKADLDEILKSIDGFSDLFEAKIMNKPQRINLIKSNSIHELSHGQDFENIIKLEGIGLDSLIQKMIYSKKSKAQCPIDELNKYAEEMESSWKHLRAKENSIPLNSPLGQKTKKIWEHMLRQSNNTDELVAQQLYLTAPTEMKAYSNQYLLTNKLGINF